MDFENLDFERLKDDLVPAIAQAIEHLLEGSRADIEQFAGDISRDLVEAQMSGDSALQSQLIDQLRLLAEINSIRIRNSTWLVVSSVVSAVIQAAVAGAVAAFL